MTVATPLEEVAREDLSSGLVSWVLLRWLLGGGLICRFEDKEDPVIQFSPALDADKQVLSKIAEVTDSALAELERRIGATS